MGLMKLCLFLVIAVVVAAAPHSSAVPESTNDWACAYGLPDFAFFGGYSSAEVAKDSRRLLLQYGYSRNYNKYLSYHALKKNNIPCGQRGSSYYSCIKRQKINPYRRGCAAITGCARFTD